MFIRRGTRKNYRIWFLPISGISSCGLSQGKIISVNWLLCYRDGFKKNTSIVRGLLSIFVMCYFRVCFFSKILITVQLHHSIIICAQCLKDNTQLTELIAIFFIFYLTVSSCTPPFTRPKIYIVGFTYRILMKRTVNR